MENNNESIISVQKKSYTLIDYTLVLLSYKKFIFIVTALSCIIAILLYFFVFDPIYFSSATIKSSNKSSGLLGSIGDFSDFGGLDDFGLTGGKSAKELATYEEILNSRRCIQPLIEKFDIMNREKILLMEDAIASFKAQNLVIDQERLAGVMIVGVNYKDPQLAKEMVDFLVYQLDMINIELNIQDAKKNKEFIENRYLKARIELKNSEDSLKSFQIVYGISPDLQVKASAQAQFTLEAELKAEQVKLDVIKKILSPDQIEVQTQEAKINSLKQQISEIQNSTDLNNFLRLGNSPQIVMSFLRLQREIEINSKIVSFLLPLYEQAKIEETKNTPTITVLDESYIPVKKSKPKRLKMILAFTFFGFVISSLSVLFYDRYRYIDIKKFIATSKNNES